MSTNSGIEWTDHTFNPWHGCTKVHAGCTNCYAEALDKRFGDSHWGNNPRRMVLGEWGKPAKWNAEAQKAGTPARVFCASMCDLFEEYDGPVVNQQGEHLYATHNGKVSTDEHGVAVTLDYLRSRVFYLIAETPWLEWLLLTKRPENIMQMVPPSWWEKWPTNVMTGTSPCNQETADECVPKLLHVPGRHFLSCEPLLGPLWLPGAVIKRQIGDPQPVWVIVGCESRGKRAGRFADGYVEAALDINRQCRSAGVPVFNKQVPIGGVVSKDPSEWPEGLRAREFPAFGMDTVEAP